MRKWHYEVKHCFDCSLIRATTGKKKWQPSWEGQKANWSHAGICPSRLGHGTRRVNVWAIAFIPRLVDSCCNTSHGPCDVIAPHKRIVTRHASALCHVIQHANSDSSNTTTSRAMVTWCRHIVRSHVTPKISRRWCQQVTTDYRLHFANWLCLDGTCTSQNKVF